MGLKNMGGPDMAPHLLEVINLTKHFVVRTGALGWSSGVVRAVDAVSFAIPAGATLGLVGESGCGKTTTSKLILALEKPTAGSIRFEGRDVATLGREGERAYRRSVQAVFQDPYASLDPRMRVATIVAEPLVINADLDAAGRRRRVAELLDLVGLPSARPRSTRTSSPAASASVSPSPARSRSRPSSSCSTSPSRRSTSRSAPRS